jgi:ABC-type amino acid transport system permease subunit
MKWTVDDFLQKIKISSMLSEKPKEIIIRIAWLTAIHYAMGLIFWAQAEQILGGVRGRSQYPITSSRFWLDCIFLSLFMLVFGAIVGLIVGVIIGSLIALIRFKSKRVTSEAARFKVVVYLVNLMPVMVLFLAKLPDTLRSDYLYAAEYLGLLSMTLAASAFYISRRFWKWWSQEKEVNI